ncbi:MAG: hypothetical protein KGI28_02365 [Thaumarchaeota archaeon]|nr:hypothetical protein [Nitrososphaerota archaeon]
MKKRQTLTTLQTIINLQDPSYEESTSNTISQDKIKFRRRRINQLHLRGYTNVEISNFIGCSLRTIEKDLHDINELSRHWFEEQSIKDFCQSLQDSIILLDNAIKDLQILYAEHDDLDSKLKILSKIPEFEEKKYQLYFKTKSVQMYLGELSK